MVGPTGISLSGYENSLFLCGAGRSYISHDNMFVLCGVDSPWIGYEQLVPRGNKYN